MITDLGVCGLRTLTRLRRVSLAWNKRLTEDGLAALLLPAAKHRPKRGLQELDLSCCVGLTDGVCEVRILRREEEETGWIWAGVNEEYTARMLTNTTNKPKS